MLERHWESSLLLGKWTGEKYLAWEYFSMYREKTPCLSVYVDDIKMGDK